MKQLTIFFFLLCASLKAQPVVELQPQGFLPLTFETPAKPFDKLLEASRSWAAFYNKKGYDVFDVTENSLSISARKDYAYIDRNIGVTYDYNITYTLKAVFQKDHTYTLTFVVNEIYANEVLTKTTVADFFLPDGSVKRDFEEDKESLEKTAERIIKSYSNFIAR